MSDEFIKEQLDAIEIDVDGYEFCERLAILLENNPLMHISHVRNKARKELRMRILRAAKLKRT